VLHIL